MGGRLGRVGPYALLERLGRGGMGEVYLAATKRGEQVALKMLREPIEGDADARLRLDREVRALRRVESPYVARVLDADLSGDRPYLVMEHIAGDNLLNVVKRDGPMPEVELIRLARGLATALAIIHAAGIVHRDLKPANVLIGDEGPVLIDFGIAQVLDATRMTQTGTFLGTPGYAAPELFAGEQVGEPADLHAWAATVAFAATGRPTFGGGSAESQMYAILHGKADLKDVPPALLPQIRAAFNRDPAKRPTAAILADRMTRLARAAEEHEVREKESQAEGGEAADGSARGTGDRRGTGGSERGRDTGPGEISRRGRAGGGSEGGVKDKAAKDKAAKNSGGRDTDGGRRASESAAGSADAGRRASGSREGGAGSAEGGRWASGSREGGAGSAEGGRWARDAGSGESGSGSADGARRAREAAGAGSADSGRRSRDSSARETGAGPADPGRRAREAAGAGSADGGRRSRESGAGAAESGRRVREAAGTGSADGGRRGRDAAGREVGADSAAVSVEPRRGKDKEADSKLGAEAVVQTRRKRAVKPPETVPTGGNSLLVLAAVSVPCVIGCVVYPVATFAVTGVFVVLARALWVGHWLTKKRRPGRLKKALRIGLFPVSFSGALIAGVAWPGLPAGALAFGAMWATAGGRLAHDWWDQAVPVTVAGLVFSVVCGAIIGREVEKVGAELPELRREGLRALAVLGGFVAICAAAVRIVGSLF
ncbi:serine/threonine-protein kinase [Herbidospora mongoliensis]|uniref:serine/threonine-protein kinase n=1 Tax=Herbidospora mongoliensis TaxID=688067 RepID=UPI00082BD076|nr:serine/threonine-protein kinase [Herbidospora mongoliensis]